MGGSAESVDGQIRQALAAGNLEWYRDLLLEKKDLLIGTFTQESEVSAGMSVPDTQPGLDSGQLFLFTKNWCRFGLLPDCCSRRCLVARGAFARLLHQGLPRKTQRNRSFGYFCGIISIGQGGSYCILWFVAVWHGTFAQVNSDLLLVPETAASTLPSCLDFLTSKHSQGAGHVVLCRSSCRVECLACMVIYRSKSSAWLSQVSIVQAASSSRA
jgi:hypothetical protein